MRGGEGGNIALGCREEDLQNLLTVRSELSEWLRVALFSKSFFFCDRAIAFGYEPIDRLVHNITENCKHGGIRVA